MSAAARREIGAPSAFFREHASRLSTTASIGPTLGLACGRGRHALAAAYLGLSVVAIDREDHVFRLPARPASIVQGTVRDPDGVALANVRVAPLVPSSAQERSVTSSGGRYQLRVKMSNDSTFPIDANDEAITSGGGPVTGLRWTER